MADALHKEFLRKHGAAFELCEPCGAPFQPIAVQPDKTLPNGWGCICCSKAAAAGVIKASTWSQHQYKGTNHSFESAAPRYSIETLRRHCNISNGQRLNNIPIDKAHDAAVRWMRAKSVAPQGSGARSAHAPAAVDGSACAPSRLQVRIVLELVHGWGGKYLSDYSKRCMAERNRGADIPFTRCSAEVAHQIVMAASECEFEIDRRDILPHAAECSWQQDKADNLLLMKYRSVNGATWKTHCRVIDAVEPQGDRATQCAKDMEKALQSLLTRVGESAPRPQILQHCLEVFRNASADGEPTEQLAFRLIKSLFPNLDFITRAEEHSASLVLDKACKKCEYIAPLLQRAVNGLTKNTNGAHGGYGHAKSPGGFARFVTSSHKLRRKYKEQALADATLAATALCAMAGVEPRRAGSSDILSFCMARFDSIVDPLEGMLRSLRTTVSVLADECADPSGFNAWAHALLVDVFNFDGLVTLALTCDVLICGRAWVHGRDQKKRGTLQSICCSRRLNTAFSRDLHQLIVQDNPVALSSRYGLGVANRVLATLKDTIVVKGIPQGQYGIGWPGGWEASMQPLCKARVLVKWIKAYMGYLFPCDSLQESLSPFDLDYWPHGGDAAEHDLLLAVFAPMAATRNADVNLAISGYFRVRNLADVYRAQGPRTAVEYWEPALRERSTTATYPDFAKLALPMMAQFHGNGELEGDHSRIKHLEINARHPDPKMKRALVKVLIDGPRPDAASDEYIDNVIAMYITLYGKRDMTKIEKACAAGTVVDVRRGVKRPHLHCGKVEEERKRRKQFASCVANNDPASRSNVLGVPPDAAAALRVQGEPDRLLMASRNIAQFDNIGRSAVLYNGKLIKDRLPHDSVHFASLRAQYDKKEAAIAAARRDVDVSNPLLDAAVGKRHNPRHVRTSGRPQAIVFSASWPPGNSDREILTALGHQVTSNLGRAWQGSTCADLAFTSDVSAFLHGARSLERWTLVLLGCGLVDQTWMQAVRKFRCLPPARHVCRGMRTARVVEIDGTFNAESATVGALVLKSIREMPRSVCQWSCPDLLAALPKSLPRAKLVGAEEKKRLVEKDLAAKEHLRTSLSAMAKGSAKARATRRVGAAAAAEPPSSSSTGSIAPRRAAAPVAKAKAAPGGARLGVMANGRVVWDISDLWRELCG